MLVSILNRVTGVALTVGGLALLGWWLLAIAGSASDYATFKDVIGFEVAGIPLVVLALVGLTWAFWMHFFAGLRHLVMDTGSGLDLKTNRFFAVMTIVGSLFATALTWFFLLGVNR